MFIIGAEFGAEYGWRAEAAGRPQLRALVARTARLARATALAG
jgi:hypothetical protein